MNLQKQILFSIPLDNKLEMQEVMVKIKEQKDQISDLQKSLMEIDPYEGAAVQ